MCLIYSRNLHKHAIFGTAPAPRWETSQQNTLLIERNLFLGWMYVGEHIHSVALRRFTPIELPKSRLIGPESTKCLALPFVLFSFFFFFQVHIVTSPD